MKNLGWILIAFLVGGCGQKTASYSILPTGQTFQQSTSFNNKLDILFVIDDQPNMSAFQTALVTSFQTFMNTFQIKGYDFKIAVVTTSGYLADSTLSGYSSTNVAAADFNDFNGSVYSNVFVLTPLDPNFYNDFGINAKPSKDTAGQDVRAFSSFRQALQSTRPIDVGFLRPDSFLAVVIVDNTDDFSGNGRCAGCNVNQKYNAPTLDSVSTYINFLNTTTGTSGATARYNVSAMTQTGVPCQGGTNMTRIMDLVNQTNGILGDICQPNFGSSLSQMSDQITMLSTQFFLTRTPIVSTIIVAINGVSIVQDATNGWTYSSTANSIEFHGTAIPPQAASIAINFTPTTVM